MIINMLLEKKNKIYVAITDESGTSKSMVLDKPQQRLSPKERKKYVLEQAIKS